MSSVCARVCVHCSIPTGYMPHEYQNTISLRVSHYSLVSLYVFVCARLTADGEKLHFFPISPLKMSGLCGPVLHYTHCVWPALFKPFYSDGVNLGIIHADTINIYVRYGNLW